MRLGVLDVGSNTVHLLVVDAHRGAHPMPASSEKTVLRLAERLTAGGDLSEAGADDLVHTVAQAKKSAKKLGCADLMAFATSAVRDCGNVVEVLARVREETGVDLRVLTGTDEARLTFLAARRWLGWSAGRLLVLDIGGGSLELAIGMDEAPDYAKSVPLGAGRITRERFSSDPPSQVRGRGHRRVAGRAARAGRQEGRETGRTGPGGGDLEDVPLACQADRCRALVGGTESAAGAHRGRPCGS